MMHPKATRAYISRADRISQEFIGRLRSIRDAANETPPNFSEEVNRWTMESISCIALDTRLGVLSDYTIDEKSKQFIKSVRAFFNLAFQVDVNPPIWRWFSTPTFKKLIATSDELTEIVGNYVDEAIERLERNPTPEGQEAGVLEKLMKINKHTAKVMAFDMLLAGADTVRLNFDAFILKF
jgi:cytochrome P450 family 12